MYRNKPLLFIILFISIFLSNCATIPPSRMNLSSELRSEIKEIDVRLIHTYGIGAAWVRSDSSAATAQYGLLGALIGAAVDGIANTGPRLRAESVSERLDSAYNFSDTQEKMLTSINEAASNEALPFYLTLEKTQLKPNRKRLTSLKKPTLYITSHYILSEDGTAMKAMNHFSLYTPNSRGKEVYKNRADYYSGSFTAPTLTEETKKQLEDYTKALYQDDSGNPPEEGTDRYKSLQKDLKKTQDDKFEKSEIALLSALNWTENNGAAIAKAMKENSEFVANVLIQDLQGNINLPTDGFDITTQEHPERVVIISASPKQDHGTYRSEPVNNLITTSWGNAVAYADSISDRKKAASKKQKAK